MRGIQVMIKILIVDDEVLIRKGMKKILSRLGTGFVVAGEAANGLEALELIKQEVPDVVITDVKMPFMDGLELVDRLEDSYPAVKKVILSGYSEFNYVRDAMKHGAVDYLLKPVDDEELANLLKKLERDILREEDRRKNEINTKVKLQESLPLLKEEFIRKLIKGEPTSGGELKKRLEYFNLNPAPGKFVIIVASIDNYRYLAENLGIEDVKLKIFAMRNIAEEIIAKYAPIIYFMDGSNFIAAVSVPEKGDSSAEEIAKELYDNLLRFSGFRFTMCTGLMVDYIADLSLSYEDALQKLKYRFYYEKSTYITSNDINAMQKCTASRDMLDNCIEKFTSRLKNCIEVANHKLITKIIEELCLMFKEFKLEPADAKKALSDICVKLQMWIPEFDKSLSEIYGYDFTFTKALDMYDTLDELKNYLVEAFEKAMLNMAEFRKRKDRKSVEIIKEYIQKHYNEDVNLNKIVEVTFLSSCYVSDLFKNKTGENIIDYLTRVRIEKAKTLLKDVKIKTYEVSQMVGYEDATYFSKVFKKVVGVSPTEYRNMIE